MIVERFSCDREPRLRVVKTADGDVLLSIVDGQGRNGTHGVRFCTLQGGGKSPETLKALRLLFDAMERDNAADPSGNPRNPRKK